MLSRFKMSLVTFAGAFLAGSSATADVRSVTLQTKDLVYDPTSGKLFASVPGSAGVDGNSVVSIDPGSLSVGPFVFVGSEPGNMAVSDDGQYLYVGLDGSASVRRVHIPTRTAGLQFALGVDSFFGPLYPEDLAVQPGHPGVVAVSLRRLGVSPRHGGVAVFDEGVQRPTRTPDHTGSNVIEWSFDPATLLGYNNETTDFRMRRMRVDASGVTITAALSTSISGFGTDIFFHENVLYSTNGVAVDPTTGATLGTYPGVGFASSVVADEARDEVYFLTGSSIRVYRLSTFTFLESIAVAGVSGSTDDLVRWGSDGLAFRTTNGQVFLISEDPLRSLGVLPSSGELLLTQDFDLALVVTAPGAHVRRVATATLDGVDLTAVVRASLVRGWTGVGAAQRETLRVPGFGQKVRESFGPGQHTLNVTLDLTDGTQVTETAAWNFLDTLEAGRTSTRP